MTARPKRPVGEVVLDLVADLLPSLLLLALMALPPALLIQP